MSHQRFKLCNRNEEKAMQKPLYRLSILLGVLLMLMTSSLAYAQDPPIPPAAADIDPETVIRSHFAALNAGDIDSAMEWVAEDAVMVFIPPPPGIDSALDKEGLREWLQIFVGRNGQVEITELYMHGDKVAFAANVTEDFFTSIGVPYMFANYVAIVQGGLLKSFTITFTDASQAVFDAAFAEEMNKEVVRRRYDEMWSQGNLDLVEELHHPDFVDRHIEQPGVEGMRMMVTLFREAFPDMTVTYDTMVAQGDIVVTEVTYHLGAYQGGMEDLYGIPDSAIGTEVTGHAVDYARFQDGKIIEAWGLQDELGWFLQFGFALTPPTE